jgi:hypothetical protein
MGQLFYLGISAEKQGLEGCKTRSINPLRLYLDIINKGPDVH